MMLEKRHHETIFYGSNKMNTLPHAAAPAMSIITQNLRGQNNQETRRNISRLAVTSRDWRDHIRHSPSAEGSDLADYRQWLAEYQEQLAAAAGPPHINLVQGDTADDPIEL